MIVETNERGQLLIPQTEHARICGTMARAWGGADFEPPRPLEPVVLAAAEHDNGWAEWEAAPRLNPETGRPYSYRDIPIDQHLEIYRRGIARAVDRDTYAGVLVSLHGSLLYERFRSGQPGAATFLQEQRDLRARLLDELRNDASTRPLIAPNVLETNRALIFGLDALSLFLCHGRPGSNRIEFPADYAGERTALTLRRRDGDWDLDPFPFDVTPLDLSVWARQLPAKRHPDRAAFLDAWETAEELKLDVRLHAIGR